MSEHEDKEKENQSQEGREQKVRVVVDRSAEIEALQEQLRKITEESRAKAAEAEKLSKEKADLESSKGNLQTEKESLEATLKTIAEKEFNAKKTAVLERVKGVFKDPIEEARVKEIEARLNDPEKGPENLKQTEYMMGVLEDNFKRGKEEAEKAEKLRLEKEAADKAATAGGKAPTGGETATLSQAQQTGASTSNKIGEPSFDSYEAMIRDLRARARDTKDPAKQAEAEAILKELWKKWGRQVKADFEQHTNKSTVSYEPKEEQKTVRKTQKEGA